jgi:hypothetical protein
MVTILGLILALATKPTRATELVVDLGKREGIRLVGVIQHWDEDGKARFPVDPKAKIDSPRLDARAQEVGKGRWAFRNLPKGRYDLVILMGSRVRIEGFSYPPINEFDPFLPSHARPPDNETRELIMSDISKLRHYENKVTPLFMAGNEKQVRILMQLVRDQPTSVDSEFGSPVATVRHEVWQYTNNYGGWVKDRRTEVLDRVLMAKADFQRWTWIWEPRLGGIEVGEKSLTVVFEIPKQFDPEKAQGWFPN